MSRKLVIGDIHGALKALDQLLAQLKPGKADQLIFVGDYVDGWSESAQVIDYLIELEKTQPCIFLKGNHDDWCEHWLRGEPADEEWVRHGGKETMESYRHHSKGQIALHMRFFHRMRFYYLDDTNRLFVHAGFSSMHGPVKEHFDSNFFWDRTLWEVALATDHRINKDSKLYPKRLTLFPEIYIGHTPTLNYDSPVPMQAANVWNIDTGAAFTGRLTALDIETKQFWQSDPVYKLYPNEKGRNK